LSTYTEYSDSILICPSLLHAHVSALFTLDFVKVDQN
jgi:hypothetical protein